MVHHSTPPRGEGASFGFFRGDWARLLTGPARIVCAEGVHRGALRHADVTAKIEGPRRPAERIVAAEGSRRVRVVILDRQRRVLGRRRRIEFVDNLRDGGLRDRR